MNRAGFVQTSGAILSVMEIGDGKGLKRTGLEIVGYTLPVTMVGDSGSGGSGGLVPAPAAGDANRVLRGDATWGRDPGGIWAHPCTYVSGTGTAGTDNTAMTVKTIVLPANTLTQVGDRARIRTYFKSSSAGGSIVCSTTINGVTIADTTHTGGTALGVDESWLHYIDDTHANIIEQEGGGLGALSAFNVSGFKWSENQDIDIDQTAVASKHIIVAFIGVDIFPKGVV